MNTVKRSLRIVALLAVFLAVVAAVISIMATNAQAALNKQSESYEATIELTSLDVGIEENGKLLDDKKLSLSNVDKAINPGKKYQESLAAANTGDQPEYMRVSIHTYWKAKESNAGAIENDPKAIEKDPKLIELSLGKTNIRDLAQGSGWIADNPNNEQTDSGEQIVLYSENPVNSKESLQFADALCINKAILQYAHLEDVTDPNDGRGISFETIVYDYDGYRFCIDIEVDAVQTHNAADAIKGAWGVDAKSLGINVGGAA